MRKKKEEELSMWEEYMDQRKQARIKEEEDLKKLKERQVSMSVLSLHIWDNQIEGTTQLLTQIHASIKIINPI